MPAPAARNIVLVGFMGTGKSIVGKALARRLGWKFVDTDALIEELAGERIPEIFERDGEGRFRELETAALRALQEMKPNLVVATGGGIVVKDDNWPLLRALGPVVLLEADVETVLARIKKSGVRRPLLEKPDPRAEAQKLLQDRAPYYARADRRIATRGKSPEEIAAEIVEALDREGLALVP